MLAQTITDDMTQCPRCAAARREVEGDNEVEFIIFECGSQGDKYSAPWWMDECYRAAGVEALTSLVADRAYMWHAHSKVVAQTGGSNLFEEDLHQAVEWLHEAQLAAAQVAADAAS